MNKYIFLTAEGHTFQPEDDHRVISKDNERDVENLQVLGIAEGYNQEEAFHNLKINYDLLSDLSYIETFCYQLVDDYESTKKSFYLKIFN